MFQTILKIVLTWIIFAFLAIKTINLFTIIANSTDPILNQFGWIVVVLFIVLVGTTISLFIVFLSELKVARKRRRKKKNG